MKRNLKMCIIKDYALKNITIVFTLVFLLQCTIHENNYSTKKKCDALLIIPHTNNLKKTSKHKIK